MVKRHDGRGIDAAAGIAQGVFALSAAKGERAKAKVQRAALQEVKVRAQRGAIGQACHDLIAFFNPPYSSKSAGMVACA